MKPLICLIPCLFLSHSLIAQDTESTALSIKEAVAISLKNNLAVQISKESRTASKAELYNAEGLLDWTMDSGLSYSQDKGRFQFDPLNTDKDDSEDELIRAIPPQKFFYRKRDSRKELFTNFSKPFTWGGRLDLKLDYSDTRTSHRVEKIVVPDTKPKKQTPYRGSFTAKYSQDLLRKDNVSTLLKVTRKGSEMADTQFQLEMIKLVLETEDLYWDLVGAQRNRENKQQALEFAKRQLRETQIKADVGMAAKMELAAPEAHVAQAEKELIDAENAYQNAQDSLIQALYPTGSRPATIQTTDAPPLSPVSLDENTAQRMALENRLELKIAKLELEQKELHEKEARNSGLPQLTAWAEYKGNTRRHTDLGPVNGDLSSMKYPGYGVGLTLSMKLQNRAAKGNLIQRKSELNRARLSLNERELQISLEVRKALRNVIASEKSIHAAEKAREQHQKDVDATQKKFSKGMSTNFEVLTKQKDLDQAKWVELTAQIEHAKNLADLDKALGRVLETRGQSLP